MTTLLVVLIALFSAYQIHPVRGGRLQSSTEEGGICSFKNNTASCCARIQMKLKICIVIQVRWNELKSYAALTVNDRVAILQELKVGEICVPLFPGASACVDIYWVNGSFKDKELDVCLKMSLIMPGLRSNLDLQCLSFKAGQFSLTADQRPSFNPHEGKTRTYETKSR